MDESTDSFNSNPSQTIEWQSNLGTESITKAQIKATLICSNTEKQLGVSFFKPNGYDWLMLCALEWLPGIREPGPASLPSLLKCRMFARSDDTLVGVISNERL